MQQKRPDWFPEGLWVLMCMAGTALILWPLAVWIIAPVSKMVSDRIGLWTYALTFGIPCVLLAAIAYRQWRRGLLPFQQRATENLHRELGLPPPVWPDNIQQIRDGRAEEKRLRAEIKVKWTQPGARNPPMN